MQNLFTNIRCDSWNKLFFSCCLVCISMTLAFRCQSALENKASIPACDAWHWHNVSLVYRHATPQGSLCKVGIPACDVLRVKTEPLSQLKLGVFCYWSLHISPQLPVITECSLWLRTRILTSIELQPTAIGLLHSSGWSSISTAAKNASMSMWTIVRVRSLDASNFSKSSSAWFGKPAHQWFTQIIDNCHRPTFIFSKFHENILWKFTIISVQRSGTTHIVGLH